MARQFSTTVRDAWANNFETTVGTAPKLMIRTGAAPAACSTADSGTLLDMITLPSDWLSASSSGTKSLLGTWQANASSAGTAGHYRIKDSTATSTDNTGTTHEQGTVGMNVILSTNGTTAANSNLLNFASTTGVAVGQTIAGTGVATGATVLSFTGTVVTMSLVSSAGVASSAAITFGYDLAVDNISIGSGQQVTITTYTLTMPGA